MRAVMQCAGAVLQDAHPCCRNRSGRRNAATRGLLHTGAGASCGAGGHVGRDGAALLSPPHPTRRDYERPAVEEGSPFPRMA